MLEGACVECWKAREENVLEKCSLSRSHSIFLSNVTVIKQYSPFMNLLIFAHQQITVHIFHLACRPDCLLLIHTPHVLVCLRTGQNAYFILP